MIRVELLCLLNLVLVGLLPRLLFRPGRLNSGWWLTAGPLLVVAAVQIAALAGWVTAQGLPSAAAPLTIASMLLIACTIGTHRQRISMWHQTDQQSAELVTWGPYALVRHPLYCAFQLTLLACALAVPHLLTLAALLCGLVQFHRTAVLEEARLLASSLGSSYREYSRQTGRFIPLFRLDGNRDQL